MFMKSIFRFSKQTKRNYVPKILKDPKFTRTGVSLPKKFYPSVSIPDNIPNSHLYVVPN